MNKPLRVLIVEDSEDDAWLLLDCIRRGGYEPVSERVQTADSLRAALNGGEWDLVLSDYVMPQFDAPAAIEILAECEHAPPLIVVSGIMGEEIAVETLKLGAEDYLLKQNLARLVPAIERVLRAAETRRKHRFAEHMKSLIMANSLDIICTIDAKGDFVEISAAAQTILGYSAEELADKAFLDFVHPDDRERTRAEAGAITRGRHTKDFENRYIRKDGATVHLMWSAIWSEPDRVMIGVARDITQRRKNEEALRLTLERLQLAVKAGRAGIWDYDLKTGTVNWDEQMKVLYGLRPDALEDGVERWYNAIHPEDLPKVKAIYEAARGGGRAGEDSFEVEFRILRADNDEMRTLRAMGTVLRDASGQPSHIIGINWDVTEERAREEKLNEALLHEKELVLEALAGERAKSEFLAVMSHEIRTPMNGVLGFAELLSHAPSLPADCKNYAETILQSGEALLRILDDILDFSRLEAGGLEIEKSPFQPRKMLQDIRSLLAQPAADKRLKLLVVVDDGVPEYLVGDAGRLRQILLNLAGNAIKFTESGSVTLGFWPSQATTTPGPGMFEFSVKDTGSGIAPGQIDLIFRPFTQADSSISRRHGGTGLGLTISRRLTELLGGSMMVRSQPGRGSEFLVGLAMDAAQSPEEIEAGAPPDPLDRTFALRHPLRILLVEDDRVNLKLILALIRRLGYEPLAAHNGREAVEIYRSEKPQCLLMDLQMPEMDGIEATEKIRANERAAGNGHAVFIAALTANIFPLDRRRCFEAGMNSYLNKPVKLSTLAETLAQASDFTSRHSEPEAIEV
jgi:PAS domain S-box-containing protein